MRLLTSILMIVILFIFSKKLDRTSKSIKGDSFAINIVNANSLLKEYRLVWNDEFNIDGAPDSNKWEFENGFVRNKEDQWYQSENAICSAGKLVITGKKEFMPNPNYIEGSSNWRTNRQNINYTSASLKQKKELGFRYGRVEVRAKIVTQEGLWPAIWTLGVNGEWPSNGECDIMEYYKDGIHANFARGTKIAHKANWNGVFKNMAFFNDLNWDKKFHVWKLEWDENTMQIYVDDQLLNSQDLNKFFNLGDGHNPFRQKHYLLLNLALGGNNGGNLINTTFPSQYLVDYVRVYQKK